MRSALILILACAALLPQAAHAQSAGGLTWTAPAGWTSKGTAPMRAATYPVDDAECVVYFFGQGQGGSVQANIERWVGQFTVKGGHAMPKTGKRTVNGLEVTDLDISGTYAGMAGATPLDPKSDTRMLASIVENPGGNLYVKFTGPVKTVTANEARFNQLVKSIRKQ